MAGALDTKMRATAQTLVQRFGKSMTFKMTTTEGTFDENTSEVTGEVVTDITLVASPPFEWDQQYSATDTLNEGELMVFVAALDAEGSTPPLVPHLKMPVIIDGERWITTEVNKVYSGELVALYTLKLNKGTRERRER